jgi:MFS family permease
MSSMFRSLVNYNYRVWAGGAIVSNIGTWMQRIAQDWLVLSLTGSATAVGFTTALQFLPMLLFGLYGGVLVDRLPKRRALLFTQTAMALTGVALAVLTLSGHVQVWHVYLAAFAVGLATVVDNPARQSFVSEMVGPDDITNAVGLNSATFNTARILGPGLAGLMIGALGGGAWATGWVILINAASYGAVIWQLEHMDTALLHSPKPVTRTPGLLLEGVRYIRSQPKMMAILVMVFFAGTFGMNFQITSALMATHVFGKGAGEFGILGSAMAVGSLTGALLAARRVRIRLRLVAGAAVGFGLTEIVAGLMPTYLAFALVCPLIGVCTLTMLNSANATMQLESLPALRGRVMALYMTIVMGGTPIGSPIIGWVGQQFGARWTLLGGGMLTILGVVLAVAFFARPTRDEAGAEPERVRVQAA